MNIVKQKQAQWYRKKTVSYYLGEVGGKRQVGVGDKEVKTTMFKMDSLQGNIAIILW